MDREKKMEFQGNSSGTSTEDPRTPTVSSPYFGTPYLIYLM